MICVKRNEMSKDEKVIGARIWFFCPGCQEAHAVRIMGASHWSWNGNLEKPTFRPSLIAIGVKRCHSFITDGKIQFLNDSTHDLAGQTVDIPELPEWLR